MKNKRSKSDATSAKLSLAYKVRNSPRHQTKTATWLKVSIVAGVVLSAVLGCLLVYLVHKSSSLPANKKAQQEAAQLVTGASAGVEYHTVTSSFGFALRYDAQIFTATGQVTDPKSTDSQVFGQEYKDTELDTKREYSIVKFHLPDQKTGAYSFASPEMTVVTNIRKDYFASKRSQPGNANKTDQQLLVEAVGQTEAKSNHIAGQPVDVSIAGVSYQRVVYTQTDKSYGITTSDIQIVYLTVQNGRPYIITVSGLKQDKDPSLSLFEAVIKTIAYTQPDTTKLSMLHKAHGIVAASAEADAGLPEDTANIPNALDPDTVLRVVARNQPAVVRVGTVVCADLALLLPNGSTGLSMPGACDGGIGSGSFVSADGYVATNAHVTEASTPRLILGYVAGPSDRQAQIERARALFQYLVKSGLMTVSDINDLLDAAQAGDQTALDKLNAVGTAIPEASVKVTHVKRSYILQTSNDPLRIKRASDGTLSWTYTKTNIAASYVDSDIDPDALRSGLAPSQDSTHSDVAILKAKGKFPVVRLGSISGIQPGDGLTAIGFPAFVDDGVETKQVHTVPSVTQGSVEGTTQQTIHTLILTSVPIAEGNSGGPAFDSDGRQIGLNTYGVSACDDHKCFGNGIVRDIADYKDLLTKNHIRLATDSGVTDDWSAGIDAISRADYKTAVAKFRAVNKAYPANYLVEKFLDLAESKSGGAGAALGEHTAISVVKLGFGVVVLVVIAASTGLVVYLVRGHRLVSQPVTGFGAGSPAGVPVSYQAPMPPMAVQPQPMPPQTVVQPQPQQIPPANNQRPPMPPAA